MAVRETRLTHLGIHLLCLASIFALNALKLIPMPILYGKLEASVAGVLASMLTAMSRRLPFHGAGEPS